ncbi:hypothetical protein BDW68DRAFT_157407 [Aspergillus falconensis]
MLPKQRPRASRSWLSRVHNSLLNLIILVSSLVRRSSHFRKKSRCDGFKCSIAFSNSSPRPLVSPFPSSASLW